MILNFNIELSVSLCVEFDFKVVMRRQVLGAPVAATATKRPPATTNNEPFKLSLALPRD